MNTQEFVLKWLVESGWQAGCMAVCTFGLLAVFRGSIPPRWRYALWLLVACRLLLPSLPTSSASVYRYIPASPAVAWEQALPETPAPNLLPTTPPPATPSSLHEPAPAPSPVAKRQWDRKEILFALWLAGVAVGLGWLLIKQVAFYRHFLQQRTRPDAALQHLIKVAAQDCGLRQPPRAYLTSGTAGPSLFGFLVPTLLLPPDIQTRIEPARLRLVILHECMHLKRSDLWTHWISLAVAITHWWNPLAWWVIARIRIERELATDATVLEVLRQDQQKEYGETLLALARSEDAPAFRLHPSIGIFEKHADLKSRLRQAVGFARSKPIWSVVGALCLAAMVLFFFSKNPVPSTPPIEIAEKDATPQENGAVITTPGEYQIGTITLDIPEPTLDGKKHILRFALKHTKNYGTNKVVRSIQPTSPTPEVETDKWAFAFNGDNEIWFFNGKEKGFWLFEIADKESGGVRFKTYDNLRIPQERVPRSLLQWAEIALQSTTIETANTQFEDGMALWKKVKEKYATCDSFYCEGEGTTYSKDYKWEGKFSIRFQRPDLLRVDEVTQSRPNSAPYTSSFFTKDGRYFSLPGYDDEIKEIWCLEYGMLFYAGDSRGFINILGPLLLEEGGYFRNVTAKIVGEKKCDKRDYYTLELSAEKSGEWLLVVDKKTLAIAGIEQTFFTKEGYSIVTKVTYTVAEFDKKMPVEEFEFNDTKRPYTLPPSTKRSESERKIGKGLSFLRGDRQIKVPDAYRKAEAFFSEAIQEDPKNGEAWRRRGEMRFILRDYESAFADAKEALKLKPNDGSSLMLRGQIYHALGQYDKALRDYDAIQNGISAYFYPSFFKALSCLGLGRLDDAYNHFKASWEESGDSQSKHKMALTALLEGKNKQAQQDFSKLKGLWNGHGQCVAEYLSGNLPAAQKRLSALCQENPGWIEGAMLSYAFQVKSGKVSQFPDLQEVKEPWKVCLTKLGRNEISLKEALVQVAHPEDELQTRVRQADCYLLAGYQALAKKSNQEALEHFTKSAKTGQMLSHTYLLARAECKKLNPKIDPKTLLPQPMLVSAP